MRNLISCVVLLVIAGCTELPDVPISDRDLSTNADYPKLVNIQTLELTAKEDEAEALKTEQSTAARVAGLRARAAELRRFDTNP